MASLNGKVVAISGAASGMGLATAKLLYAHGAKLSLTDVRKDALDAAVATIKAQPLQAGVAAGGAPIYTCVTDVRVSAQVDAWIEQTVAQLGGLDGAVNLAGVVGQHIGEHGVTDLSDEEWAFVTDINLTGVFYATRAELRAMRKPGDKAPRSIVNAASTAGLQGNQFHATYSASKHGVIGLSRSAAKEVGHDNIRVNVVAPGVIDTPMVRTLSAPLAKGIDQLLAGGQALGRLGDPAEVARTIAFLLGEDSTFITGAVISIDGGEVC